MTRRIRFGRWGLAEDPVGRTICDDPSGSYAARPEPAGKCRVCGHDRAEHTYAWPIGCHVGTCNCPQVFVKDAPRA